VVETGQYQSLHKNIARTYCADFARYCTPFRALFCVQMPIGGNYCRCAIWKVFDFTTKNGAARQD
jgi:hypothetical protein